MENRNNVREGEREGTGRNLEKKDLKERSRGENKRKPRNLIRKGKGRNGNKRQRKES